MNKEDANRRLAAIESEARGLRAIVNAPEPRTPEVGDATNPGFASAKPPSARSGAFFGVV